MRTRVAEWHGISTEIAVYLKGWVVSLVFHGMTVASAVALFGDMRLPNQPEPLTLNVSVVDRHDPDPDITPSSEPVPRLQTPAATRPPHPSPATPLATTPAITDPPSGALPGSHMEASHQTDIPRRDGPEHDDVPVSEPRDPADHAKELVRDDGSSASEPAAADDQAKEPITAKGPHFGDGPAAVDPAESRPAQSESSSALSVARVSEDSRQDPPSDRGTKSAEASRTEVPTEGGAASPQGEHAQTSLPNHDQDDAATEDHQSQLEARQMAPASKSAPRPDHGWLISALRTRVLELQRYPVLARSNHWEGRVVLKIVIGAQGQLRDLKLVESSGHHVLDQDAEILVRQVFPLQMTQALAQPHLVVSLPIIYRLDR
jgi:TonB family protein